MYYSTEQLESRGWTKSLIKKFLPKPDHIKNFRYGCAYFYGQIHVAEIEQSVEFRELQIKALKRRESAIRGLADRRKEYLDYLENRMPVRVKELAEGELIERAITSYNNRQMYKAWRKYERGYGDEFRIFEADQNSDPQFLERITVNFIRHRLTSYDNLLANTHGKLSKQTAIDIIQRRVFTAMVDVYPEYRNEIKRQCAERGIELPESVNYEFGEQMSLFSEMRL